MSYGKFAQITSALLTRKGEAAPSFVDTRFDALIREADERETGLRPKTLAEILEMPPEAAEVSREPRMRPTLVAHDIAHESAKSKDAPRDPPESLLLSPHVSSAAPKRRIVLTLSSEDYERLGIAAVKLHSTPHDLALAAVFEHLDAFARDYGGGCRCIHQGGACGCDAPAR